MSYLGRKSGRAALISDDIPDNSITSAKIVAGAVAASDVAADVATQAELDASVFDDVGIRHDILTLALKQAVQEDSTKFNLPNSSVVQFQADADFNLAGSTTVGRNDSEYIEAVVTNPGNDSNTKFLLQPDSTNGSTTFTDLSYIEHTITGVGGIAHTTAQSKFGATSIYQDDTDGGKGLKITEIDSFNVGTGVFTLDAWVRSPNWSGFNQGDGKLWDGTTTHRFGFKSNGATIGSEGMGANWTTHSMSNDAWHHIAWVKKSTTVMNVYIDGARLVTVTDISSSLSFSPTSSTFIGIFDTPTMGGGEQVENVYLGGIRFSNVDRTVDSNDPMYVQIGTDFSVPTGYYGDAVNATATALGTTNVPSSAVTEVSGVMLLKHAYGANDLGTDVKVYFTANNSAWTEASSYTDAGTFSTGIKMIKLGKTTCTSGSDVRWKIVWANQVDSTKIAYVYGIGLNY